MALNLNQLTVFRAILDSTSITEAARTLRISQPAASKQLADLEASLGGHAGRAPRQGLAPQLRWRGVEMLLIIAPSHPFAQSIAGSIDPRELSTLPYIVRERGSGTRDVVEEALARHGVTLTPMMSLGSTEAVKHPVSLGLGTAFVSRLTVELELSSGRLRALELQDFSIRRALSLLTLEGKPPSPMAREFLRLLRERYPGLASAH